MGLAAPTKIRYWNDEMDVVQDCKALGGWILLFAISVPLWQKFILWPLARLGLREHVYTKGKPHQVEEKLESRPSLKRRAPDKAEGLESYRDSDSAVKLDVIGQKLANKQWKLVVAATKLSSYVFFLAFSYWALQDQWGWFWNSSTYHLGVKYVMPYRLRLLYFMETAYYLYTLVAMFWEPKMKDRPQMVFHHLFTLCLLTTSYCWKQYRYGTVIMVLHDFSDPWMEAAKIFNYLGMELGANLCFSFFALSFYYLRVYIFPRYVIKATYDYARPTGSPHYWLTFVSLFGLWVLHCIWSAMIYRVFHINVIQRTRQGDIREDED